MKAARLPRNALPPRAAVVAAGHVEEVRRLQQQVHALYHHHDKIADANGAVVADVGPDRAGLQP